MQLPRSPCLRKKDQIPLSKSNCYVDNGSSTEEEENDDNKEEGSSDEVMSEDEESRGFAEDPDEPVDGPSGNSRNQNHNSIMEETDTEGKYCYGMVWYLPTSTIVIPCQM